MKHGASAYRNGRCRCDECRAAHRDRVKEEIKIRHQKMVDGEIEVEHGTISTYRNYACRCDECSAAQSAANRSYHERIKG